MTIKMDTGLQELFEALPDGISDNARERVLLAYEFTLRAHDSRLRESGERYVDHDLAVAQIMAPLDVDVDTLIACLLHDILLPHTGATVENVEEQFGSEVASLVGVDSSLPIIGKNIFSHESGIHVNGMMKSKSSYEPFTPKEVGLKREFPIGKHSGSSTLIYHLKSLGIEANKEIVQKLLPQVRDIVTKRKKVLNAYELKELYLCSLDT